MQGKSYSDRALEYAEKFLKANPRGERPNLPAMIALAWLEGYECGTRETATSILSPEAFDHLVQDVKDGQFGEGFSLKVSD